MINKDKNQPKTFMRTLRSAGSFLVDLLFQNDRRIDYTFGNMRFRGGAVKLFTLICPQFFFYKTTSERKKNNLAKNSFRTFKKLVKPLFFKNSNYLIGRGRIICKVSPLIRFFCIYFILEKYYLNRVTTFMLNMQHTGNVSLLLQFYFYWFKLLVYPYEEVKWGTYLLPAAYIFGYYRYLNYRANKIRHTNKFCTNNLPTVLNEEKFVELSSTEVMLHENFPVPQVTQPVIHKVSTEYSRSDFKLYARNTSYNKGRYPRNRQTYRTGVLWCVWLTVLTIFLPSYLWYGLVIKFSYLWFVIPGAITIIALFYYLKTKRWTFTQTTAIVQFIFLPRE